MNSSSNSKKSNKTVQDGVWGPKKRTHEVPVVCPWEALKLCLALSKMPYSLGSLIPASPHSLLLLLMDALSSTTCNGIESSFHVAFDTFCKWVTLLLFELSGWLSHPHSWSSVPLIITLYDSACCKYLSHSQQNSFIKVHTCFWDLNCSFFVRNKCRISALMRRWRCLSWVSPTNGDGIVLCSLVEISEGVVFRRKA